MFIALERPKNDFIRQLRVYRNFLVLGIFFLRPRVFAVKALEILKKSAFLQKSFFFKNADFSKFQVLYRKKTFGRMKKIPRTKKFL